MLLVFNLLICFLTKKIINHAAKSFNVSYICATYSWNSNSISTANPDYRRDYNLIPTPNFIIPNGRNIRLLNPTPTKSNRLTPTLLLQM